jgi:hypothetical protein
VKAVITWVAPGLFDATRYLALHAPAAREQLPEGRRRTLRQAADLARGRHPLTGGLLHPDAAPADNRKAPGHRCGGCQFRVVEEHHNRTYPKCWWPNADADAAHPRVSSGSATDIRSWWPGCESWEPREAVSI